LLIWLFNYYSRNETRTKYSSTNNKVAGMHMTRFTRFLRDKSRNENYAWKMRRLSDHACPMGYHDLIDRPGMPLLSHTEGGRFITPRERTVWISVHGIWRKRDGRSGIPDARASTSLSLRPSQGLDGMRLAYRSQVVSMDRIAPVIFFNIHTYMLECP